MFKFLKKARGQLGTSIARGHPNLDPHVCSAIFRIRGLREQDHMIHLIGSPQPNHVVEASQGLLVTDIHVVNLHWSDFLRAISVLHQARQRHGLVTIVVLNSKCLDRVAGEHPLDDYLNLGARGCRKHANGCDDFVLCASGEVPIESFMAILELARPVLPLELARMGTQAILTN